MPAGKKRVYRKKSTGFKKSVVKIAKSVLNKEAETRTGTVSWLGTLGLNGYLEGVYKNVTKGDNQENRDGDRIRSLGIKVRGTFFIDNGIVTTNEDSIVTRMVVFTSKRPITTLTDAGLTWNSTVDPEIVTILYDHYITFKKDGRVRAINKYIKFHRTVSYESSSVTKNEIYVAFIPYQNYGAGVTATTGMYRNLTCQYYFKDI